MAYFVAFCVLMFTRKTFENPFIYGGIPVNRALSPIRQGDPLGVTMECGGFPLFIMVCEWFIFARGKQGFYFSGSNNGSEAIKLAG